MTLCFEIVKVRIFFLKCLQKAKAITLLCKNNCTFALSYHIGLMQAEQLSLFDDFNTPASIPSPFLGRRVVVTGTFSQSRQTLRSTLLKLGASEVRYDKLQRGVHFLLAGENPVPDVISYWRLYVHDGYNIRRLSAEDLQRIQGGDYAAYQTPEEMAKELHLTHEHLYWTAPEISSLKETRQVSPVSLDLMDVLYGKEIFVHRSIMESMPQLAQALGGLGAYANIEMSDDIDFILIPKDMPAEICDAVEDYYNSSRSTMFNVPFVILEDLLSYLQERIQRFPDEVLSQLINIL
jgi:hypothetical protein